MSPVCWKCKLEMHCKQNDFRVDIECFLSRLGDLYECPECHCQIVTGFGEPFDPVDFNPSQDSAF